jgi:MFS family permease
MVSLHSPAHTESQPGVIAVLRELTSVSGLGPLLGTLALISFLNRSMATSNVLGYYEKRFGVPTYQLGFLSSIYALASLVAQSFLVGPAARILGERRAIIAGLMCAALGNAAEGATQTVYQYLIFSLPITVCATSVVSACSKSLISMVAPRQHIGKCLGVVDIIGSSKLSSSSHSLTRATSNKTLVILHSCGYPRATVRRRALQYCRSAWTFMA